MSEVTQIINKTGQEKHKTTSKDNYLFKVISVKTEYKHNGIAKCCSNCDIIY